MPAGGRVLAKPGRGSDTVANSRDGVVVHARDDSFDRLECGDGRDVFFVDELDLVTPGDTDGNCERIRRLGAPRAAPTEGFLPEGGFLEIGVACPFDRRPGCRGTVTVYEHGRALDRENFRLSAGKRTGVAVDVPYRAERRIARRGALVAVLTRDPRGGLTLTRHIDVFVELSGEE